MLLVVFAVVVVIAPACDADRTEAVRHYSEGIQTFEGGGSSAEAAQHMERALEVDPTFHLAAFQLGMVQQEQLDDPEEAEHNYRRALEHESDNERYAFRLGTALAEQGEHEEAIEYFEEALELDSEFDRAWYAKGMSQDAAGRPQEAVDSLMEAIRVEPRMRLDEDDVGGEHYHALADLYLRYRLYDDAVEVYENGVRNNPDSARLHHGLGIARMELGRYDEAVESFEAALEIDENHPAASVNIAKALEKADRVDEAITRLEELAEGGAGMTQARSRAVERRLERLEAERDED